MGTELSTLLFLSPAFRGTELANLQLAARLAVALASH